MITVSGVLRTMLTYAVPNARIIGTGLTRIATRIVPQINEPMAEIDRQLHVHPERTEHVVVARGSRTRTIAPSSWYGRWRAASRDAPPRCRGPGDYFSVISGGSGIL